MKLLQIALMNCMKLNKCPYICTPEDKSVKPKTLTSDVTIKKRKKSGENGEDRI